MTAFPELVTNATCSRPFIKQKGYTCIVIRMPSFLKWKRNGVTNCINAFGISKWQGNVNSCSLSESLLFRVHEAAEMCSPDLESGASSFKRISAVVLRRPEVYLSSFKPCICVLLSSTQWSPLLWTTRHLLQQGFGLLCRSGSLLSHFLTFLSPFLWDLPPSLTRFMCVCKMKLLNSSVLLTFGHLETEDRDP